MKKIFRFSLVTLFVILMGCQWLSNFSFNEESDDEGETEEVETGEAEAGADGIGDPYYEQMGLGGYDVQRYTLIFDVDMENNEVVATTRIEANATQGLSAFNFDFAGLTVDEVLVNDARADFLQEGNELVITPQEQLANGNSFTVEVDYHGEPGIVDTDAGDFTVGWYQTADGTINVYTEPDGAYVWFPNNNHPRDKATYRFEITVDDPWIAAANGTLVDTQQEGGRSTYIFEMNEPMASYLATMNIDRYTVTTMQGPDGILVRNYFPDDFSEFLRGNFDILPEAIEYLSSQFGPYPFEEYGVLIMDNEAADCNHYPFADETQTLAVYCPYPLNVTEDTIVHELAHEWFGNSVSLESWQDLWLKEGMATYAWCLWDERDGDFEAVDGCMQDMAYGYRPDYAVAEPPADDLYRDEVYVGGALVFHALRLEVGDDVFFDILRTYLERYQGGAAGTDEFIAIAEEVSGQDLQNTFDEWLLEPGIPDILEMEN